MIEVRTQHGSWKPPNATILPWGCYKAAAKPPAHPPRAARIQGTTENWCGKTESWLLLPNRLRRSIRPCSRETQQPANRWMSGHSSGKATTKTGAGRRGDWVTTCEISPSLHPTGTQGQRQAASETRKGLWLNTLQGTQPDKHLCRNEYWWRRQGHSWECGHPRG